MLLLKALRLGIFIAIISIIFVNCKKKADNPTPVSPQSTVLSTYVPGNWSISLLDTAHVDTFTFVYKKVVFYFTSDNKYTSSSNEKGTWGVTQDSTFTISSAVDTSYLESDWNLDFISHDSIVLSSEQNWNLRFVKAR